jgi:hypothetical protein
MASWINSQLGTGNQGPNPYLRRKCLADLENSTDITDDPDVVCGKDDYASIWLNSRLSKLKRISKNYRNQLAHTICASGDSGRCGEPKDGYYPDMTDSPLFGSYVSTANHIAQYDANEKTQARRNFNNGTRREINRTYPNEEPNPADDEKLYETEPPDQSDWVHLKQSKTQSEEQKAPKQQAQQKAPKQQAQQKAPKQASEKQVYEKAQEISEKPTDQKCVGQHVRVKPCTSSKHRREQLTKFNGEYGMNANCDEATKNQLLKKYQLQNGLKTCHPTDAKYNDEASIKSDIETIINEIKLGHIRQGGRRTRASRKKKTRRR